MEICNNQNLDSKVLTADRREELFLLIKQLKEEEKLDYKTDVLTAKYISNSMLKRTPESLNKISYESAFGLIDYALDKGYNLEQVHNIYIYILYIYIYMI